MNDGIGALEGARIFVADVHLSPRAPERGRAFSRLLSRLARPPLPAELFILGDLFDVWLGASSLDEECHQPALAALKALTDSGVLVTALQGNRDYLLDGRFTARSGVRVVAEWLAVALGPFRAYLCHGDQLVVGDRAHQMMRWALRSAVGRAAAASLPERGIQWAARWLRRTSDSAGRRRQPEGLSIAASTAARIARGGYDVIIAGHLHNERHRAVVVDGRRTDLYTVGAWEDQGSILVFDGERFAFRSFPIESELRVRGPWPTESS